MVSPADLKTESETETCKSCGGDFNPPTLDEGTLCKVVMTVGDQDVLVSMLRFEAEWVCSRCGLVYTGRSFRMVPLATDC